MLGSTGSYEAAVGFEESSYMVFPVSNDRGKVVANMEERTLLVFPGKSCLHSREIHCNSLQATKVEASLLQPDMHSTLQVDRMQS